MFSQGDGQGCEATMMNPSCASGRVWRLDLKKKKKKKKRPPDVNDRWNSKKAPL
jgi:hypothetical protein